MSYIRTKYNIFEVVEETDIVYRVRAKGNPNNIYSKSKCQTDVISQAESIEELCDEKVGTFEDKSQKPYIYKQTTWDDLKKDWKQYHNNLYGAIWTEKGLIYVAKMNDKGELELCYER